MYRKMHTRAGLTDELRRLGIARGQIVMVHASLRAVGLVLGGADALIDALLDVTGPDGAVMAYIGCEPPFDDLGRRPFARAEERFLLEHCPTFDPHTARAAREFGAFPEILRTRPDAKASDGVCARVAACGRRAGWLVAGHMLDHGFGHGSPFEKLCQANGKVLLLGSDRDQVTLLHHAEAIAPIPDKRTVRYRTPLLRDGRRVWVEVEELETSTGIRPWPERFFAEIVERFLGTPHARQGQVGHARSCLLDAGELVAFAVPLMVETAARLDASERFSADTAH